MPTQGIADTECTPSLQSQEHVPSDIHSGQVQFNGLDIVVLGHLCTDWGTQVVYICISIALFILSWVKKNYFIPFCATVKTITPSVLWMTDALLPSAFGLVQQCHRAIHSTSGVIVLTVVQKGVKKLYTVAQSRDALNTDDVKRSTEQRHTVEKFCLLDSLHPSQQFFSYVGIKLVLRKD